MKKLILLPLLFVSCILFAQQYGTMYVAAKTGLSVREKQDAASKVLDKIPYGTKITLLETNEERKRLLAKSKIQ